MERNFMMVDHYSRRDVFPPNDGIPLFFPTVFFIFLSVFFSKFLQFSEMYCFSFSVFDAAIFTLEYHSFVWYNFPCEIYNFTPLDP